MLKPSFNVSPVLRNQKLNSIGFFKVTKAKTSDKADRGIIMEVMWCVVN